MIYVTGAGFPTQQPLPLQHLFCKNYYQLIPLKLSSLANTGILEMSKVLRSRHVNYAVLEESSGLSPKDFSSFWATIQTELRKPKNSIGFNGLRKSGVDDYEDWVDQFIADGIGELGWGNGVTKWQYGRKDDQAKYLFPFLNLMSFRLKRPSIRKFMHLLIRYIAAGIRSSDKAKAIKKCKVAQKSAKLARKPVVEKAVVIDSDGEDFGAQGQALAKKMLVAVDGDSTQPILPIPQAALYAATGAPDVGVFRTKISPFGPTKFVYTDDAATVTEFLEVVRKKWDIPSHSRATGVRVFMDGQEICVDITEERDWVVVKRFLSNGSGVADALIDFIH